jgi:hypothetical protein
VLWGKSGCHGDKCEYHCMRLTIIEGMYMLYVCMYVQLLELSVCCP